jgi:hypothetical protein
MGNYNHEYNSHTRGRGKISGTHASNQDTVMQGSFERQPQSTNTGTRPTVRFPMGDEEDQKVMIKKADSLAELCKEIELAEKQDLKLH